MSKIQDGQLVERALKREEAAFEELVYRHSARVLSAAMRMFILLQRFVHVQVVLNEKKHQNCFWLLHKRGVENIYAIQETHRLCGYRRS